MKPEKSIARKARKRTSTLDAAAAREAEKWKILFDKVLPLLAFSQYYFAGRELPEEATAYIANSIKRYFDAEGKLTLDEAFDLPSVQKAGNPSKLLAAWMDDDDHFVGRIHGKRTAENLSIFKATASVVDESVREGELFGEISYWVLDLELRLNVENERQGNARDTVAIKKLKDELVAGRQKLNSLARKEVQRLEKIYKTSPQYMVSVRAGKQQR